MVPQSAGVTPATQRTWNFLGGKNVGEFKPAPLSTHFASKPAGGATGSPGEKPAGGAGAFKTSFQFGKNIAPPKATEVSAEVLKDLAEKKDKDSEAPSQALASVDAAQVSHVTGEEQEKVLFKAEAKLYEFEAKERKWQERGVGTFRLNQLNSDHSRNRLLMHVKTTLKLILNSPLFAGMSVMPMEKQPCCVKFSAVPMPHVPTPAQKEEAKKKEEETAKTEQKQDEKKAEEQPGVAVFNVRFKDAETAALALKTIKETIESQNKPAEEEKKTEETKTETL